MRLLFFFIFFLRNLEICINGLQGARNVEISKDGNQYGPFYSMTPPTPTISYPPSWDVLGNSALSTGKCLQYPPQYLSTSS